MKTKKVEVDEEQRFIGSMRLFGKLFLQNLLLLAAMVLLGFFVRDILNISFNLPLNSLFAIAVSAGLIGIAFAVKNKQRMQNWFTLTCYSLAAIRIWCYFFFERSFENRYFPIPLDNQLNSIKVTLILPFVFECAVLFGILLVAVSFLRVSMRKGTVFPRRLVLLGGVSLGGILLATVVIFFGQPVYASLESVFFTVADISRTLMVAVGAGLPLLWVWRTRAA